MSYQKQSSPEDHVDGPVSQGMFRIHASSPQSPIVSVLEDFEIPADLLSISSRTEPNADVTFTVDEKHTLDVAETLRRLVKDKPDWIVHGPIDVAKITLCVFQAMSIRQLPVRINELCTRQGIDVELLVASGTRISIVVARSRGTAAEMCLNALLPAPQDS